MYNEIKNIVNTRDILKYKAKQSQSTREAKASMR
jgi:hypothetical protein